MEDFVPFLLAKKLKEKGFREKCFAYYMPNNTTVVYNHNQWRGGIVEDCLYSYNSYNKDMLNNDFIDAPTISQVLKWLRDRNIHIEPFLVNAETVQYKLNIMGWNGKFFCSIYNSLLEDANNKTITTYQSYEQAALAGVNYCLENLI